MNLERLSRSSATADSARISHRTRQSVSPSPIGTVQCVTLSSAATFALNSRIAIVCLSATSGSATFPHHSTLSMAMSPGSNQSQ